MRRRNLLENTIGTLTLSSSNRQAGGSSGETGFSVSYNDVIVTDYTNIKLSSNQSWVNAAGWQWRSWSNQVWFSYAMNNSFTNSRTAIITVTYKGASAEFTLEQSASWWSIGISTAQVEPSSGSKTGYLYINGQYAPSSAYTNATITANNGATITKDSSYFTVSYGSNTSTSSTKTYTVSVTFQGTTQTLSFTQKKDYVVSSETITGSGCDTCTGITEVSSLFTVSENGGVYTNSQFTLKVGDKYDYSYPRNTYASGNISNGSTTRTNTTNEYITIGAGELPIESVPTSTSDNLTYSSSKTFTNSDNFKVSLSTNGRIDFTATCSNRIRYGGFHLQDASTNTYRLSLDGACGH